MAEFGLMDARENGLNKLEPLVRCELAGFE